MRDALGQNSRNMIHNKTLAIVQWLKTCQYAQHIVHVIDTFCHMTDTYTKFLHLLLNRIKQLNIAFYTLHKISGNRDSFQS